MCSVNVTVIPSVPGVYSYVCMYHTDDYLFYLLVRIMQLLINDPTLV
jgi:hypothetical protein